MAGFVFLDRFAGSLTEFETACPFLARLSSRTCTGFALGSLVDPERKANTHIRIHAQEGRLFRKVIEDSAAQNGLAPFVWRERDLYERGGEILQLPAPDLRTALSALRRSELGQWRAEQKAAALAAWLVLAPS